MEFWGVEVKPGQAMKCEPGEERALHLSQAALGETKGKGAENVPIYVKINDQKLVIGTLSSENCAQISYDLVFEKEFELSHGAKNVSVYFCGYKSDTHEDEEEISELESDDDVPEEIHDMIKKKIEAARAAKSNVDKETNGVAKPKDKAVEATKAEPKADDEENDDDSVDDLEGSDDDEDMMEAMGDSDDDDDSDDDEDDESSEEEEEATPKKSANGKKRLAESGSKTPVPEKKAKLVTPAGQKTGGDGKKGAHVGTPHPAKQAGKTPANGEKAKQQTPKSAGSVSCKSCSKSFNSDTALQAHTKAKHGGGK